MEHFQTILPEAPIRKSVNQRVYEIVDVHQECAVIHDYDYIVRDVTPVVLAEGEGDVEPVGEPGDDEHHGGDE